MQPGQLLARISLGILPVVHGFRFLQFMFFYEGRLSGRRVGVTSAPYLRNAAGQFRSNVSWGEKAVNWCATMNFWPPAQTSWL